MSKNVRLVTKRGFADPKAYEAIEINAAGYLEWVAEDGHLSARFPTTFDHLRSLLAETGREFDPLRLPVGVKEFRGHGAV